MVFSMRFQWLASGHYQCKEKKMTFTHALATNNYGPAKFIVSANVYEGTHTTIAAALTSASSGDTIFIRPGTYTENPTLKAGVNLTTYTGDGNTGNVIILGKCTFTGAGTVAISNIQLKTNSDFAIAVTGSSASVLNLYGCYLNCNNNTGITYTSSSGSSAINMVNCSIDHQTTGITAFVATGAGILEFQDCRFKNTGGTSTASSTSACRCTLKYCNLNIPLSATSTGAFTPFYTEINTSATNTTALTTAGTQTSNAYASTFGAGSSSAISIGSGSTVALDKCSVDSSNINAIAGAGTLQSELVTFTGSSSTISATTQITFAGVKINSIIPIGLPSIVKAWASWDATPTIIKSFNVTSITNIGAGITRVNFTNSFSGNNNYSVAGSSIAVPATSECFMAPSGGGTVLAASCQLGTIRRDTGAAAATGYNAAIFVGET
jgi:hypothetical protein